MLFGDTHQRLCSQDLDQLLHHLYHHSCGNLDTNIMLAVTKTNNVYLKVDESFPEKVEEVINDELTLTSRT